MSNITRRDFIKALGALAGAAAASQFDNQLGAMARALSGPQEWVLGFDEAGLEQLILKNTVVRSVFPYRTDRQGSPVFDVGVSLNYSESDIWALATLTDPDGGEWRTVDGENWTQGERMMSL